MTEAACRARRPWRSFALAFALALAAAAPALAECRVELRAVLPITLEGSIPTVDALIDGHPVSFGIDTGAQGTILTPETVARLHLKRDLEHFTTAIGRPGRLLINNALPNRFEFAGEIYQQKSIPVIDLSQPHADGEEAAAGTRMGGILGADLLSLYDLDIDIPNRTLSLYRVQDCEKLTPAWNDADYMTVPLRLSRSGRPLLAVELDGKPATAIFDSGARFTLLAPPPSSPAGSPPRTLFVDGDKPAAPAPTRVTLKIGEESLPPTELGHIEFPLGEADMLIGEDYMRSRRFWLSYATRTLFVRPASGR